MKPKTYLGFDFGKKGIGVAVGGTYSGLAEPVSAVRTSEQGPDWDQITRLVQDWAPDGLVVGLPLNMDDTECPMTEPAREFAEELKRRYALPVHLVDERLTTVGARHVFEGMGLPGRRYKDKKDVLAAQLILQAFLNDRQGGQRGSEG